jgi:hypothetical protein
MKWLKEKFNIIEHDKIMGHDGAFNNAVRKITA